MVGTSVAIRTIDVLEQLTVCCNSLISSWKFMTGQEACGTVKAWPAFLAII
jgi:hypothetical protein